MCKKKSALLACESVITVMYCSKKWQAGVGDLEERDKIEEVMSLNEGQMIRLC